jgi:hypothetical protein
MADDALADLTLEEFETWLTPPEALHELHSLGDYASERQMFEHLCAGLVKAAARLMPVRAGGEPIERCRIPRDWWVHANNIEHGCDFWKVGFVDFVPDHGTSIKAFGTRFEPDGVRAIIPIPANRPAASSSSTAATAPPLSDADRMRFARVYAEVFGASATEPRAFQAVKAAYPEKFVARDRFLADFRAIRGKQVPGRKGKTE